MKIKFRDGTEKEFANLRGADLRNANLSNADLRGANLRGADLRGANLSNANLYGANLYGADLRNANLSNADLRDAHLYGANLYGANLSGADLRGADLRGAHLRGANLSGASLSGANLYGADLSGANLENTKYLDQFKILPEGVLIGYKKLKNGVIAKLRISAKAKRVNAYGSRKCRAEYVTVISGSGVDVYSSTIKYTPGTKITPDSYDPDPRVECSHGIHFFITEQEAQDY